MKAPAFTGGLQVLALPTRWRAGLVLTLALLLSEVRFESRAAAPAEVHFLGAARFIADSTFTPDPDAAAITRLLELPEARAAIQDSALDYLRAASGSLPGLRFTLVEPGSGLSDPERIRTAAFAVVGFDAAEVVTCLEDFGHGQTTRQIVVTLPLMIVSARTYEVLFARSGILHFRLGAGVDVEHPKVRETAIPKLRRLFKPPEPGKSGAVSIESGVSASTGGLRMRYGIRSEDIRFCRQAASAENGFGETSTVARLIRCVLEANLGSEVTIVPQISSRPDQELQKRLGIVGHGLEVLTDLDLPIGFPSTSSGRYILPVMFPPADTWISCHIDAQTDLIDRGLEELNPLGYEVAAELDVFLRRFQTEPKVGEIRSGRPAQRAGLVQATLNLLGSPSLLSQTDETSVTKAGKNSAAPPNTK